MLEWSLLTILAWLIFSVAIYLLWKTSFRGPALGLDQRMDDFAKQAVSLAELEHQIKLDYSIESIGQVEAILQLIHAQHQQAAIPERELSRIVLTWGGYLGIVLKRKFGGTWNPNSSIAGQNTYPLQWNTREAVPVIWCLRQIRNGESDGIRLKTDAMIEQLRRDETPAVT